MPSRRHVLRRSVTLLVASVAGCLSTDGQSSESTEGGTSASETPGPTTSAPTTDASPTLDAPPTVRERPYLSDNTTHGLSALPETDAGPLVEGYAVGDGEYDNSLRVWNGAAARDGRLVLGVGDTELLAASHEVPEGGFLTVQFHSAADYTVEIRLGDVEHTVSIPSDQFDCNHWSVGVAMRETTAEHRTFSTALACDVTVSETR
ncbi:hypothetical protein ACFPYI_00680 [Halomarina salina]|uniref:DUF1102 domain-containing protein n=1 Tax=Halomarina salina TaxID=1872699 RepID=A0ABD5RHS1_9EURY|nr:hypothetical protein [Halomarina salina]